MKLYSHNGALFFAIVLFIFTENLNAAKISDLTEIAEVEKIVTSKKYQAMQETIIMSGSDKDSRAAKATIQAIRKEASQIQINEDSRKTLNLIMDSILNGVRTVSTAELFANSAFDEAKNLTAEDPKAATDHVKKSMKSIADFVLTCGVPIEDVFGSALTLACGSNQKGLKKGMSSMQSAGTAILESLKIGERIATMGIEAGGVAAGEGFKAAREAVATGGSAAFKYYYKGAKYVLESFVNPNLNVLSQANCVAGILESLKSEVSTDDPDALAAIDKLNNSLVTMNSEYTNQTVKDAAKIMIQALISTILETGEAMDLGRKSLEEAGKLSSQDLGSAISVVQKGMETARYEVAHGSSIGFLGFGAARKIVGDGITIDGLIPAMVEVIIGRVTAYDDLKLAEETCLMGLRGGAGAQGVDAAIQICKAAGNALFIQFLESAIMGLEFLRSI